MDITQILDEDIRGESHHPIEVLLLLQVVRLLKDKKEDVEKSNPVTGFKA